MKNFLLLLVSIMLTSAIEAQPIFDLDEIESRVHAEMQAMVSSEDFLKLKSAHPDASGEITYDISVFHKGKVLTVYQSSTSIEDVKFRNALKDMIKNHRFDFKMKKGAQHKVRHQFNF